MTKGKIELIDNEEAKALGLRKPSDGLIARIREAGRIGTKLSTVIEGIKEQAREEGFTDEEVKQLLRIYLKGSLSKNQIQWYVTTKDKMNIKRQLELKQNNNQVQLKSKANVQDVQLVNETRTLELEQLPDSVPDLKATVSTQQTYINTLEEEVKEKREIEKSLSQLRIKVSVSQLYRDVLMMRNSNAIYTNILMDNNKYVKLEPI